MPDYSKGKIYKVVNIASPNECDCYIGSTCNSLSKRFSVHKKDSKQQRNQNIVLYQKFHELGVENFRIVLLEEFPCKKSEQLRAREEYHRQKIGAAYNMMRALATKQDISQDKKDKYQENKERICEKVKQYRMSNKEKVAATDKKYYEANKDKINQYKKEWYNRTREIRSQKTKEYYQQNKEAIIQYQKQYNERNKEKVSERKKQYRENNKDNIKKQRQTMFQCECGSNIMHQCKPQHFRTQKHIQYINSQANEQQNEEA